MEGANSHNPITNEEREQKSQELWQNYTVLHNEVAPPSVLQENESGVTTLEGANEAETEEFWAQYAELLHDAKQKHEYNTFNKAITLMEDVFLSNQQQFKSVPIPLGKYYYPHKGWTKKGKLFAKLAAAWLANLGLLASGIPPEGLYPMLVLFQISSGVYVFNQLYNGVKKQNLDIAIESNYVRDKAQGLLLALRDINHIEETDKGLLIEDVRHQMSKKHKILIPHHTEEYVNIKRFLKQIEAVNLQQPNVYPDVKALRRGYWHNQALMSFGKPKRILIQKKSVKGIGNVPTEWGLLVGGASALSIASFSVLGLPFLGFLGVVGAAHALDSFKHKKRFSFNALHVADEYIQYVFNYNHKTHIIKIPLEEVYGVKNTRRGLLILDIHGKSFWGIENNPKKKYQPIIPKKMHGIETLKIFLEELADHNQNNLL